MKCVTRPRITELNPHLLCVLCGGYYIDATAIIECLHSFCKSCIIRYLDTHKYCPICDVLVHKTKPIQNLRPDIILQNLVYKIVPDLYEKEMSSRRKYYENVLPNLQPNDPEQRGEITESSSFYSSSDTICFSLEYASLIGEQHTFYVAPNSSRYFRCQAAVTVEHLQKLIATKYTLSENNLVHFFYNNYLLPDHFSLLDLAYISSWRRRGYIRILYQILEVKKVLVEDESKGCDLSSNTSELTIPHNIPELKPLFRISNTIPDSCPITIEPQNTQSKTTLSEGIDLPSGLSLCVMKQNSSVTTSCTTMTHETQIVSSIIAPLTSSACSQSIDKSTIDIQVTALDNPKSTNETSQGAISQCEKDQCVSNLLPSTISISIKRKPDSNTIFSPDVNITPANQNSVAQNSAKMPKLEIRKVEVVDDQRKKPSSCAAGTIRNLPKLQKIITTAASSTPNSLSITVTSSKHYSSGGHPISTAEKTPVTPCHRIVQKGNPPPIYTRSEISTVKSKITKAVKTFTRPWSSPTCTTNSVPTAVRLAHCVNSETYNSAPPNSLLPQPVRQEARSIPLSSNPNADVKDQNKVMKIVKSKFQANSLHHSPIFVTPPMPSASCLPDTLKKIGRNVSVTKIDPKTLSPVSMIPQKPTISPAATLSTTSSSFQNAHHQSKSQDSASPAIPNLGSKSDPNPFMYPPLPFAHMDPHGLYTKNFGPLDHMMAVNLASRFFGASLHPSLSTLYGISPKNAKERNNSQGMKSKTPPTPVLYEKSCASSLDGSNKMQYEPSFNGQQKTKSKKGIGNDKFSINNLIPLASMKHPTHMCDADGVNRICDQLPPSSDRVLINVKEIESKEENRKKGTEL